MAPPALILGSQGPQPVQRPLQDVGCRHLVDDLAASGAFHTRIPETPFGGHGRQPLVVRDHLDVGADRKLQLCDLDLGGTRRRAGLAGQEQYVPMAILMKPWGSSPKMRRIASTSWPVSVARRWT